MELEYGGKIQRGARNYLEINLAEKAGKLGYRDLSEKYKTACVIVPLKDSQPDMKVRIDGRTFVNYAEYDSGIAVPGYLAKASGMNPVMAIFSDAGFWLTGAVIEMDSFF